MVMYEINDPVTVIKGIGKKKAEALEGLGIKCLGDVIYSFPREYEDRTRIRRIGEVEDGDTALIRARLLRVKKGRYIRGRRTATTLLVRDDTGSMEVVFFNAAYIEKSLKVDEDYWFFGKVTKKNTGTAMFHPSFGLDNGDGGEGILPVYPLVSGVSQKDRRRLSEAALPLSAKVSDCFSEEYRKAKGLCGIEYALKNIHYPEDERHMKVAKYRLIYEELLVFCLGLGLMKREYKRKVPGFVADARRYEDELATPYRLTGDQERTVSEICRDLESGKRMSRLVQGDVGSGKTVVAAKAIYKVIKSGGQAALMAPTEILAGQHLEALTSLFEGSGIEIRLLTSSTPARERREILEDAASGRADLLIGTHALFSSDVIYKNLALVVTDEQHRFGVAQREALSSKGETPHILVMTATPIPRTLALVLYADMDISVIREKPAGRKEIKTRVVREGERKKAYDFVKGLVEKGRQVYIVTAVIESSDTLDVRSTEEVFEEAKDFFAPFETELLHGRMKQDEKDRIMNDFKDGKIQVLVSTVVIEVGINVPNAAVMIIENSERFGLAQLHQLRGRVGRGSSQSYCFLVLGAETDVAVRRAEIMEETGDGFIIAERDLELRGTGEFFGARQHGVPEMRIADIIGHKKMLKEASKDANEIFDADPDLDLPKNLPLRERITELYGSLEYNG